MSSNTTNPRDVLPAPKPELTLAIAKSQSEAQASKDRRASKIFARTEKPLLSRLGDRLDRKYNQFALSPLSPKAFGPSLHQSTTRGPSAPMQRFLDPGRTPAASAAPNQPQLVVRAVADAQSLDNQPPSPTVSKNLWAYLSAMGKEQRSVPGPGLPAHPKAPGPRPTKRSPLAYRTASASGQTSPAASTHSLASAASGRTERSTRSRREKAPVQPAEAPRIQPTYEKIEAPLSKPTGMYPPPAPARMETSQASAAPSASVAPSASARSSGSSGATRSSGSSGTSRAVVVGLPGSNPAPVRSPGASSVRSSGSGAMRSPGASSVRSSSSRAKETTRTTIPPPAPTHDSFTADLPNMSISMKPSVFDPPPAPTRDAFAAKPVPPQSPPLAMRSPFDPPPAPTRDAFPAKGAAAPQSPPLAMRSPFDPPPAPTRDAFPVKASAPQSPPPAMRSPFDPPPAPLRSEFPVDLPNSPPLTKPSHFDPPPAPMLSQFPVDLPASPTVARPYPIDIVASNGPQQQRSPAIADSPYPGLGNLTPYPMSPFPEPPAAPTIGHFVEVRPSATLTLANMPASPPADIPDPPSAPMKSRFPESRPVMSVTVSNPGSPALVPNSPPPAPVKSRFAESKPTVAPLSPPPPPAAAPTGLSRFAPPPAPVKGRFAESKPAVAPLSPPVRAATSPVPAPLPAPTRPSFAAPTRLSFESRGRRLLGPLDTSVGGLNSRMSPRSMDDAYEDEDPTPTAAKPRGRGYGLHSAPASAAPVTAINAPIIEREERSPLAEAATQSHANQSQATTPKGVVFTGRDEVHSPLSGPSSGPSSLGSPSSERSDTPFPFSPITPVAMAWPAYGDAVSSSEAARRRAEAAAAEEEGDEDDFIVPMDTNMMLSIKGAAAVNSAKADPLPLHMFRGEEFRGRDASVASQHRRNRSASPMRPSSRGLMKRHGTDAEMLTAAVYDPNAPKTRGFRAISSKKYSDKGLILKTYFDRCST